MPRTRNEVVEASAMPAAAATDFVNNATPGTTVRFYPPGQQFYDLQNDTTLYTLRDDGDWHRTRAGGSGGRGSRGTQMIGWLSAGYNAWRIESSSTQLVDALEAYDAH